MCGVVDSPTQGYAESSTLCISGTRSRRLSDSTIWKVGDSPYHWYGASTTLRTIDTESFLFKKSIADSLYWWCGESATLRISDAGSRRLTVSLIRRVGDSPYRWQRVVVFWIRISPRIWSQNRNGSKGSVRDSWGTDFCKNPRKSVSLPCPYKGVSRGWGVIYGWHCVIWKPGRNILTLLLL